MPGPFVVKTVSRIHPGKAEAYRPVVSEFCKLVEETEPRLLAFHIYVTDDQSSEVVIQIHPDAERCSRRHPLPRDPNRMRPARSRGVSESYRPLSGDHALGSGARLQSPDPNSVASFT